MADLKNRCPGCRRISCDGCGIYRKLNTNKQVRVQFPEGFEIEPEEGFGISFDVGTTTMAGMLWDLRDGTLLGAETGANPQAAFGADVISRIKAAAENEEIRGKLKRLVLEKLDEMALRMAETLAKEEDAEDAETVLRELRKVTVVGNTAMCEILLGINPEGLFQAPFTPDYEGIVQIEGDRLGFRFLKDALVFVLPPIGGYVGADALAVYSYMSLKKKDSRVLAVDIGTNGEILLQCDGRKYACSAAAGPALEGGAVSQGMRAAKGAVDMVSVSGRFPMQDIVSRVISGREAVGICGSGLVDALALLYRMKVIDYTGYMRSGKEAKESGVPDRICRRISEDGGERKFLLTEKNHPVYLTAGDVRQLQMSISAIRAGMEVLLKKAGMEAGGLDCIYLAGAFGCCIGIESGITAGLFPDVSREKILQAGNLAGTGAAMALLSKKQLNNMERESRSFMHVELAREEIFKELFLTHMNFPLHF